MVEWFSSNLSSLGYSKLTNEIKNFIKANEILTVPNEFGRLSNTMEVEIEACALRIRTEKQNSLRCRWLFLRLFLLLMYMYA